MEKGFMVKRGGERTAWKWQHKPERSGSIRLSCGCSSKCHVPKNVGANILPFHFTHGIEKDDE
jgi:hypothetical protein